MAIHASPEEILAIADHRHDVSIRWTYRADPGQCGCTVYLHGVLVSPRHAHSRYIRLLSR